jgi:hypothetical protein
VRCRLTGGRERCDGHFLDRNNTYIAGDEPNCESAIGAPLNSTIAPCRPEVACDFANRVQAQRFAIASMAVRLSSAISGFLSNFRAYGF